MADTAQEPTSPTGTAAAPGGLMAFFTHNRVDVFATVMRCFLVFQCILLAMGGSMEAYHYVMFAAVTVNAIRLLQRIGRPQFNTMYLQSAMLEDSSHYVLYALLFLTTAPSLLVAIPVTVFAIFHIIEFIRKLLAATGRRDGSLDARLAAIQLKSSIAYQFVARMELIILIVVILRVFQGISLFAAVLIMSYTNFLQMRYMSRRNRYPRQAWHDLRVFIDGVAANERCPGIVRTIIGKATGMVDNIAAQLQARAAAMQ